MRLQIKKDHVPGHGAILLDPVLEAVEFPARVTDLDPGLADVDAYDLPHLRLLLLALPSLSSRIFFSGLANGLFLSLSLLSKM